jgi:hypothetical protein
MHGKNYSVIIIFAICFVLCVILISCSFTNGNDYKEVKSPFMFLVDQVGHEDILGSSYAKKLKEDLGENVAYTAPGFFWPEIEPADNEFDWEELDDFTGSNKDKHIIFRVGPLFEATGDNDFYIAGGGAPDWLENRLSNPLLKQNYGSFLKALVSRYKNDVDMWLVGEEINLGGDGLSWEQQREWIKWQVGLMRGENPDGRIAISFGSWTDYHEEIPPNAIGEVEGALQLIDEDVDFDIVAMEYHYGTLQEGDLNDLRSALDNIESTGKEIFIWEIFYPGGTDAEYQKYWDWEYPPECGYSEKWQADQLYETLKMTYEDPKIIGIFIYHFQDITYDKIDPVDWEAGWRCYAGLVKSDGTPKEAYFEIKDYWKMLQ